jgi:hypothetical protein
VQCQTILSHISERFAAKALNLENNIKYKPIISVIVTNNLPHYALSISYKEKCVEVTLNTTFLVYKLMKERSLKKHIEE